MARFSDIPQFVREGSWEADFSLPSLVSTVDEWVRDMGLNLDPDFQRAHVWTEAQQVAWLEFFFKGGRTGRVLYFNHPGWHSDLRGEFVLVDGKQRLTAMRRFVGNELPIFGHLYREFIDRPRMRNTMKINVNSLGTRAEVLQWYIDYNAGGTPHSAEEIERVRRMLDAERGE